MKKLTRQELKNVMGGTDPLPPYCYCFTIPSNPGGDPGGPMGGIDPDCTAAPSSQYCPNDDFMVCC